MPPIRRSSFALSCLAYLSVAVAGSALGLLWPSMRLTWHQPLSALGAALLVLSLVLLGLYAWLTTDRPG